MIENLINTILKIITIIIFMDMLFFVAEDSIKNIIKKCKEFYKEIIE